MGTGAEEALSLLKEAMGKCSLSLGLPFAGRNTQMTVCCQKALE